MNLQSHPVDLNDDRVWEVLFLPIGFINQHVEGIQQGRNPGPAMAAMITPIFGMSPPISTPRPPAMPWPRPAANGANENVMRRLSIDSDFTAAHPDN
jgi:hypothetical protein